MIETSTSGSSSRPAAISSSRCRLAGTFPGACESTTVTFLPAITSSRRHLLLDRPLRDVPGGRQVFYVFLRPQPRLRRAEIEEPTLSVSVGVDQRRVRQNSFIESHDLAVAARGEGA